MLRTKTLEQFLSEGIRDLDIDYRVIFSNRGKYKRMYFISENKYDSSVKKKVVVFKVKGNFVKQII